MVYPRIDSSSLKFVTDGTSVDIRRLFVPLRFDFLVRVDFLRWYLAHRDLYRSQKSSFMELARQHLYFFQHTTVKTANRGQAWTEEQKRASYVQKVEDFIVLYEGIARDGFDPEHAITLHRPLQIEPTETGKRVVREFFIGDGWHRLACLYTLGLPLRDDCFVIQDEKRYAPRDNTSLYLTHRLLEQRDYVEFLSLLYEAVDDELKDVIERDSVHLGTSGGSLQQLFEDFLDRGEIALTEHESRITEMRTFVETTKFDGYQRIELPHGIVIPGTDKRESAALLFDGIEFEGREVLDVGCAFGAYSYEALDRGAASVIAIESGEARFPIAKRIAEFMGKNVTVIRRDIESEPIDEKFDIALLLNVTHHLVDPIHTIRRLAQAARELVIVEFPTLANPKFIRRTKLNRFAMWLVRNYPLIAVGDREYHNTFYFSKEAFRNVFLVQQKTFERIEFRKSDKAERWIAYCWTR